jgi:hypothetical protein
VPWGKLDWQEQNHSHYLYEKTAESESFGLCDQIAYHRVHDYDKKLTLITALNDRDVHVSTA